MSKLITIDDNKFYNSLDDAREDGYAIVKCFNVLCFYKLKGRTFTITKENIGPIMYLQYLHFSPLENRYYLKCFRNYLLEDLFFTKESSIFDPDEAIEQLKQRIADGNIYLLFRKEQVADMSAQLVRLWKANRSEEGKLGYKDWITLAGLSLQREEWGEYHKANAGFKTQLNILDGKITELWKNAKPNNK